MADYFLEDIVINILHRLPVKSLLRCTAVSKSWRSLITSPEFTASHLRFAQQVAPSLLLRRCIKSSERYELYSDDDSSSSLNRVAAFQFPFKSMNSFFTIVGSCNGLLCLSDDRVYLMNTVVLWNPSVRRSVLLPKPNLIYNSYGSFNQYLGFGFDSVSSDYKVVRITYVDVGVNPQIEVYKLSSGVWKDLSCCVELVPVICSRARQVFVNGASHWIARYMDSYDVVVAFDMCLEAFRTMKLPVLQGSDGQFRGRDLAVYMDCLALNLWHVPGAALCYSVWVMQEYGVEKSWTKKFCFDFTSVGSELLRPLWIRKQGEAVVVCQDGRLVCVDQEGGRVKDFGLRGHRSDTYQRSLAVDSFVCSLVLLERDASSLSSLPSDDGDSAGSSGSEYEKRSESVSKHRLL
ncbi:F-box protein CPR1-like [Salvia hispanica]|uniref:F-box protein CPR1-like n=1 Tax=Salvia hispanica TaxID=49212 RepID=UPI002009D1C6|nr:F-box protein CPR1-like [Salvia hispanica]